MRGSSPGAELFVDARHPPQTSLTAQAIRGDRGVPGGWLPVRPRPPAPPGCGGCLPRFWMEQAHADQPPVVIDALDRVSVQLELADDGGWEVNPASVQLGKSDRLVAGLAQALQQPLLLSVSERHRPDCRPPAGLGEPRAALAGGGALEEDELTSGTAHRDGGARAVALAIGEANATPLERRASDRRRRLHCCFATIARAGAHAPSCSSHRRHRRRSRIARKQASRQRCSTVARPKATFTRNQGLNAGHDPDITAVKSAFRRSQALSNDVERSGWAHRWAYERPLHSLAHLTSSEAGEVQLSARVDVTWGFQRGVTKGWRCTVPNQGP